MPALKTDKWPHFYFYDVTSDKKNVKVHKDHIKLKRRITKSGGPGNYHAIIAVGKASNGSDIWRWTSKDEYDALKKKLAKKSPKKSPKKSAKKSAKKSRKKSAKKSPKRCNVLSSGKKKTKVQCKRSPVSCRWVSGKRKSRKSPARKGYCRKA